VDLAVFFGVLKRFWFIVVPGLVLALGLGYVEYRHTRHNEQWVSYSKIFVTEQGFPWGSINSGSAQLANQQKLSSLAILYSQLATSDKVQGPVLAGRTHGSIQAAPILTQQGGGDALPLISIAAIDNTPARAVSLAQNETKALLDYIVGEQQANLIPQPQRVRLQVLSKPDLATVKIFSRPSKAVPIVVVLTVLMAAIALAFALENVLPRRGGGSADPSRLPAPPPAPEPRAVPATATMASAPAISTPPHHELERRSPTPISNPNPSVS
jgi:hypothetical protein